MYKHSEMLLFNIHSFLWNDLLWDDSEAEGHKSGFLFRKTKAIQIRYLSCKTWEIVVLGSALDMNHHFGNHDRVYNSENTPGCFNYPAAQLPRQNHYK